MATLKKTLFKCLEDLESEEFEKFKWNLKLEDGLPKCELEKANRNTTVDLMVQKYCEDAIKVTRNIFEEINRNDLVKCLSLLPEPKGKSCKN